MMRSTTLSRWLLAGLVAAAAGAPDDAAACGGTFCDTGPQSMPVDQSGENILFVVDGNQTEAHVQIQYTGDPARFAWVVPMPSVPDVQVSSNQLFQNMMQATVPSYGFTSMNDSCGGRNADQGSAGTGGTGGSGGAFGAPPPSGPEVVLRKTVGVFDVVVLSGGTAQEVTDWLITNGYDSSPNAPEKLAPYVDSGSVFAAIKLIAGAGLDEIHPISFRYDGTQPVIPIQLTGVAATPDMGVRTFFLSNQRVVPFNYRHMVLNPVRIDWANQGANYLDVVSNAADSEGADGHAFTTEYAGPSNIVSTVGITDGAWDPSRFDGIDPMLVVDELQIQGLASCSPGLCQYTHPLVLPLLQEYLPRPAGVSDDDFYSCLSCYVDQIDTTSWDGAAFAADLDERIVQPGVHAQDLLARNPYLTRMFTTISPEEMTVDPKFGAIAGLDDVALPTLATRRILCDGRVLMELPNGVRVAMPDATTWPDYDESVMPWTERIEEFGEDGTVTVLSENTNIIDDQVVDSNKEEGFKGGSPNDPESSSGCACSVPGTSSKTTVPWALALVGLGVAGVGLRRRHR